MQVGDANQDHYLDVLGGGNLYGVSTYQAHYNARMGFYYLVRGMVSFMLLPLLSLELWWKER
ncbi:MAG: hypothetical protein AAGE93_25125 [Bacteroidota bacterium]